MKCLACGDCREYGSALSLSTHVRKAHSLGPKEYYDRYVAADGDGICPVCGKPTRFRTLGSGYLKYCSKKCAALDIAGDDARNGAKVAAFKATCMKRFGTDDPNKNTVVADRRRSTMLERHRAEFYSQTPEFGDRYRNTCMARFGATSFLGSEAGQENMRRRNMERLGVPYRFCTNTASAESSYRSLLDGCGCDLVEYVDKKHIMYRCRECGCETTEQDLFIKVRAGSGMSPCPRCFPKSAPYSAEESGLRKAIEDMGFRVDHYDRNFLGPYGADIVVEERKLIVEYDGLFWHSELYRPDDYHLKKTELAAERGYRLIHVFSDEWNERRPIVLDRLRNALGLHGAALNARSCEVRDISTKESAQFIDMYHIQGDAAASIRYGLFHSGELVAVMTFGKGRYERGAYEMIRFCPKAGLNVRGAAGKMFARFVRDLCPSRVVTYADRRWSNGEAFYGKLGFHLDGSTPPGYSYIVDGRRESRLKYQKHKLVAGGADKEKSEHEIMYSLGRYRIYDCGNYRYVWTPGATFGDGNLQPPSRRQ